MNQTSIAVHGGAGTILPEHLTPQLEERYLNALRQAIVTGDAILQGGGTALSAVEASVSSLENFELFNAGKGSVFNALGKHEMDASIMCGKTLMAGAVTNVAGVKNPISLASKVLHHSDHVLLAGLGAEEFGRQHQVKFECDDYFYNECRFNQWQKVKGSVGAHLDHNIEIGEKKFGTVGAVAVDLMGDVAAATSTGGMTNKRYGRVGDSPLIGVGNYANNKTCAVSCTGDGEFFMRGVVAYDISALMEYGNKTLQEACHLVVQERLKCLGGEGGVIAVDALGNICLEFNSAGMYRAFRRHNSPITCKIFS